MEEKIIVEGVEVVISDDPDYPQISYACYDASGVADNDPLHWKIMSAAGFRRASWVQMPDGSWQMSNCE